MKEVAIIFREGECRRYDSKAFEHSRLLVRVFCVSLAFIWRGQVIQFDRV